MRKRTRGNDAWPGIARVGLLGLVVFVACCSLGIQSCQQIERGEVGTDVCLACHNGQDAPDYRAFTGSPHAVVGCEACHGPGALHVRNGGVGGLFITHLNDLEFDDSYQLCNRCHPGEVEGYLKSVHATSKAVRCTDCHSVHIAGALVRSDKNNDLCLGCHAAFGFSTDSEIEAHTFHPVDPEGTGASRCTMCHLPPLQREDQAHGPRGHSLIPLAPITSNEAMDAGITPTPPNSCSGIAGCHDGSVVTAPVFNVDSRTDNQVLQDIFESRYGNATR